MYALLCGSASDAIDLLEQGNVWDAKNLLHEILEETENLYLEAEFPQPLQFPLTLVEKVQEIAEGKNRE